MKRVLLLTAAALIALAASGIANAAIQKLAISASTVTTTPACCLST